MKFFRKFDRPIQIKRVCCAMSPYTVLQYLLITDCDDIDATYFFFPSTLNSKIRGKFRKKHVFYYSKWCRLIKPLIWIYWYGLKRFKFYIWPFLHTAQIFGEDQVLYCWLVLNGLSYIMLEDGTGTYRQPDVCRKNLFQMIERHMFRPISYAYWGQNEFCKGFILTNPEVFDAHGKSVTKLNIKDAWSTASERKKKFIFSVYGVSMEVLVSLMKGIENIVLTQPFSENGEMTENEKLSCYRYIIETYGLNPEVTLLKTHPRERTDYGQIFKGYRICTLKIPVELMALVSANVRRVFTLTSTGAFMFHSFAEVVWLGSRISPSLRRLYGDVPDMINRKAV